MKQQHQLGITRSTRFQTTSNFNVTPFSQMRSQLMSNTTKYFENQALSEDALKKLNGLLGKNFVVSDELTEDKLINENAKIPKQAEKIFKPERKVLHHIPEDGKQRVDVSKNQSLNSVIVAQSPLPSDILYNNRVDQLKKEDVEAFRKTRPLAFKLVKYPVVDYEMFSPLSDDNNFDQILGEEIITPVAPEIPRQTSRERKRQQQARAKSQIDIISHIEGDQGTIPPIEILKSSSISGMINEQPKSMADFQGHVEVPVALPSKGISTKVQQEIQMVDELGGQIEGLMRDSSHIVRLKFRPTYQGTVMPQSPLLQSKNELQLRHGLAHQAQDFKSKHQFLSPLLQGTNHKRSTSVLMGSNSQRPKQQVYEGPHTRDALVKYVQKFRPALMQALSDQGGFIHREKKTRKQSILKKFGVLAI